MKGTERNIVFISGLHRSGTSVLHRLLASHPDVSGFMNTGVPEDEGQHLQAVYPPAKCFGGPGRFGFDPRAHMDESHPLATGANAERIFSAWSGHWDLHLPVLMEKSPPNIIRTRFLQALFPNASFITLLRHPIAVACATEKWRRWDGMERLLRHWAVCHERFEADRPYLRRCMVLRYEDLVSTPDQTLASVFGFLSLKPIGASEPVRSGVNSAYFLRWKQLHGGLWTRRNLRRVIDRFEERVAAFGYSLQDPEQTG